MNRSQGTGRVGEGRPVFTINLCGAPADTTGVVNLGELLGTLQYQLVRPSHSPTKAPRGAPSYEVCPREGLPLGCFSVTEGHNYFIAIIKQPVEPQTQPTARTVPLTPSPFAEPSKDSVDRQTHTLGVAPEQNASIPLVDSVHPSKITTNTETNRTAQQGKNKHTNNSSYDEEAATTQLTAAVNNSNPTKPTANSTSRSSTKRPPNVNLSNEEVPLQQPTAASAKVRKSVVGNSLNSASSQEATNGAKSATKSQRKKFEIDGVQLTTQEPSGSSPSTEPLVGQVTTTQLVTTVKPKKSHKKRVVEEAQSSTITAPAAPNADSSDDEPLSKKATAESTKNRKRSTDDEARPSTKSARAAPNADSSDDEPLSKKTTDESTVKPKKSYKKRVVEEAQSSTITACVAPNADSSDDEPLSKKATAESTKNRKRSTDDEARPSTKSARAAPNADSSDDEPLSKKTTDESTVKPKKSYKKRVVEEAQSSTITACVAPNADSSDDEPLFKKATAESTKNRKRSTDDEARPSTKSARGAPTLDHSNEDAPVKKVTTGTTKDRKRSGVRREEEMESIHEGSGLKRRRMDKPLEEEDTHVGGRLSIAESEVDESVARKSRKGKLINVPVSDAEDAVEDGGRRSQLQPPRRSGKGAEFEAESSPAKEPHHLPDTVDDPFLRESADMNDAAANGHVEKSSGGRSGVNGVSANNAIKSPKAGHDHDSVAAWSHRNSGQRSPPGTSPSGPTPELSVSRLRQHMERMPHPDSPALGFTKVYNSMAEEFSLDPSSESDSFVSEMLYDD